MRILLLFIAYSVVTTSTSAAQSLPGFKTTGSFDEQEMDWNERFPEVLVKINAPLNFHKKATTLSYFICPAKR